MQTRVRRLVAAASCLVGTVGLSAASLPPAANAASVQHVTFWEAIEGAGNIAIIRGLVAQFNRTHPGVHVSLTSIPTATRTQQLATAIAGGAPPDLYTAGTNEITALIQDHEVADMSAMPGAAFLRTTRYASGMEDLVRYRGRIWGVPISLGVWGLYINKALFKRAGLDPNAPPRSWAQLLADAVKISRLGHGIHGLVLPTKPDYNTIDVFGPFLWDNGGHLFSKNLKTVGFDTPQGLGAAQFWAKLFSSGAAPVENFGQASSETAFASGKFGMMIAGSIWVREAAQYPFPTATAPVPSRYGRGVGTSPVGGWARMIPAAAKSKLGAWTFVRWLSQPVHAAAWAEGIGVLPPSIATIKSPTYAAYVAHHPLEKAFVTMAEKARLFYRAPAAYNAVTTALAQQLQKVIYHEETVAQALKAAAAQGNLALKRG